MCLWSATASAPGNWPPLRDWKPITPPTSTRSFPTTTTVALSTMATALPPSQHGILGYQLWMPDVGEVANTIHWTTLWGDPLEVDTLTLLPRPNLWERLRAGGVEPITVQPAGFAGTPLTGMLYRGCRFEGYQDLEDAVAATVDLARPPGRLVLLYLPHVDFAAHVAGQDSDRYMRALQAVEGSWSRLVARLPAGVAAVGTADHGHVDFPPERRHEIDRADHEDRIFYGDGRVMFVKGDGKSLAAKLPAIWVPGDAMGTWWGDGPVHASFAGRAPDGALVADPGRILLHRFSDRRLIGGHGGLTEEEIRVPLLVAGR